MSRGAPEVTSAGIRAYPPAIMESLAAVPASPVGPLAAPSRGGRTISALEFVIGAAIVLGHNVWRVLPNEVPIL